MMCCYTCSYGWWAEKCCMCLCPQLICCADRKNCCEPGKPLYFWALQMNNLESFRVLMQARPAFTWQVPVQKQKGDIVIMTSRPFIEYLEERVIKYHLKQEYLTFGREAWEAACGAAPGVMYPITSGGGG